MYFFETLFLNSQGKLPKNLFPESLAIRHIQISQSNIEELHDEALHSLRPHLESFSLVSAHLKEIPQKAFKGLNRLTALDLEHNQITEIPDYTFYGLRLVKLNLKGNRLRNVSFILFTPHGVGFYYSFDNANVFNFFCSLGNKTV